MGVINNNKRILSVLLLSSLAILLSFSSQAAFVPSQLIVKVEPKYPRDAFLRNLEGYVSVIFVVNEKGMAEDIEVIDEKPNRIFRKAALTALKKWRFKPAVENGRVTTDIKEVTIDFKH